MQSVATWSKPTNGFFFWHRCEDNDQWTTYTKFFANLFGFVECTIDRSRDAFCVCPMRMTRILRFVLIGRPRLISLLPIKFNVFVLFCRNFYFSVLLFGVVVSFYAICIFRVQRSRSRSWVTYKPKDWIDKKLVPHSLCAMLRKVFHFNA